jgi:LasA protease
MRGLVMLFLVLAVLACNFPIALFPDYADDIPFPTPRDGISGIPSQANTPSAAEGSGGYLEILRQPLRVENAEVRYPAQSGDRIEVVANHFSVLPAQIQTFPLVSTQALLAPGQVLIIPDHLGLTYAEPQLFPDSEVIYSPLTADFNVEVFIKEKGGYLAGFHQRVGERVLTGGEIVSLVARNTSINPRLLLAVIEYRSGWLTTIPTEINLTSPLGYFYSDYPGFYLEVSLTAKWLNMGYYGWREGTFNHFVFQNGDAARVAPQNNAGTVALQYLFAQLYPLEVWEEKLSGSASIVRTHETLFGDPWARAAAVEPMFTEDTRAPQLELPFAAGEEWALTGGLHVNWNSGTPTGALDFAPITGERRCAVSTSWARASADGVVIRSSDSVVVLALTDGENDPSGWQIFYMHLAEQDRVAQGVRVLEGEPIGHPSCEGGQATGTHVHIARLFKGEWIGAGGAFPLVLSGWTALPGEKQFQSQLVKEGRVVTARQDGGIDSRIFR